MFLKIYFISLLYLHKDAQSIYLFSFFNCILNIGAGVVMLRNITKQEKLKQPSIVANVLIYSLKLCN